MAMKTMLAFVLCLWGAVSLFATQQWCDELFYKGKKYQPNADMLNPFIKKHPDKDPEQYSIPEEKEMRVVNDNGSVTVRGRATVSYTGLVRGYIATFEIKDGQLFLKDIEVPNPEHYDFDGNKNPNEPSFISVMSKMFPDDPEPKAEWWTGILEIAYGEIVKSNVDSWRPLREGCILLDIKEGNLGKAYSLSPFEYKNFRMVADLCRRKLETEGRPFDAVITELEQQAKKKNPQRKIK